MKELKYSDKVKIKYGAWKDFVGTVGRVDQNNKIADVTVPIFGSSTTLFVRVTHLRNISDKHYQKCLSKQQARK